MIGLSQNRIYLNPVAVFCGRRWTCRAKEANCRQDQSRTHTVNDRQSAIRTTTLKSAGAGPQSRQTGHHSKPETTNLALHTEDAGHDRPGQPFEPVTARYIKLGKNGKWATDALKEGIIPFGYSAVDHHACLAGEWDHVRDQLVTMGRTANGVSQGLRELKDFYGLPDDALWVTTANGHLWWAFAEGPVRGVTNAGSDGPSRYRRTRAGWCKASLTGEPLALRSLSSALTRTASYQMTMRHQPRGLFAAPHSR